MSDQPDIKPRSRDVTDGLEKAAARGMLRAVGMGDDDFAKPQIGVASSWNEITPCNLSLDRLAKAVKNGVHAGGGYPLEFGTISVSDGISMGHEGMHFSLVSREVIADSVETVMMAERLDGSVLLAGCDKSLPGMLMAAARLDLASVFLYAGSIMPGQIDGHDVTIIDAFEAVGACLAGKITRHLATYEADILAVFHGCDAMVTDVSSVGLDWLYLQTDKPIFITDRHQDGERLRTEVPVSRCADVIDDTNIAELTDLVAERLAHDEHRIARTAMRHHYFDDLGVGDSTQRFLETVDELVRRRDRLVGAQPHTDALGAETA